VAHSVIVARLLRRRKSHLPIRHTDQFHRMPTQDTCSTPRRDLRSRAAREREWQRRPFTYPSCIPTCCAQIRSMDRTTRPLWLKSYRRPILAVCRVFGWLTVAYSVPPHQRATPQQVRRTLIPASVLQGIQHHISFGSPVLDIRGMCVCLRHGTNMDFCTPYVFVWLIELVAKRSDPTRFSRQNSSLVDARMIVRGAGVRVCRLSGPGRGPGRTRSGGCHGWAGTYAAHGLVHAAPGANATKLRRV
jgi:hypothetical protein